MDAPVPTDADQTTETESNRSHGFSFTTYLLSFVAAVILYALSPAKCARAAYGPTVTPAVARAAEIAYAPILLCCDHFPAVAHFYNWYIKDIWGLT